MSAAERGSYLESPPEAAPDIEEAHQVCGRGGVLCVCLDSGSTWVCVCVCVVVVVGGDKWQVESGRH
jgi:hypothetical protein